MSVVIGVLSSPMSEKRIHEASEASRVRVRVSSDTCPLSPITLDSDSSRLPTCRRASRCCCTSVASDSRDLPQHSSNTPAAKWDSIAPASKESLGSVRGRDHSSGKRPGTHPIRSIARNNRHALRVLTAGCILKTNLDGVSGKRRIHIYLSIIRRRAARERGYRVSGGGARAFEARSGEPFSYAGR